MKTVVHVNQHKIKSNHKTGEHEPVLTVKTYKSNDYASEVVIIGPCRVVYRPDNPLPCGAKVWIETHGKVVRIINGQKNTRSDTGRGGEGMELFCPAQV
jgi:hypothetical protein